jgi:hypothetical protein
MPEAILEPPTTTAPTTESLGWRAGLPDDLKTNEAFVPYKTVGEFAKTYLDTSAKAADLAKKLEGSVPKLSDNATDAERAAFYDALGRPKQPSEYEFDGEDKNASEWTSHWKQQFHSLGLTKTQAKALSQQFNGQMQKMVEAHNAALKNEYTAAENALRSEYGDKFDTNVELAKRVYQKHLGNEFDKDFSAGTDKTRLSTIKMLVKLAALTGEDSSPQGGQSVDGRKQVSFIAYDKSPAPPKR